MIKRNAFRKLSVLSKLLQAKDKLKLNLQLGDCYLIMTKHVLKSNIKHDYSSSLGEKQVMSTAASEQPCALACDPTFLATKTKQNKSLAKGLSNFLWFYLVNRN